MKWPGRFSLMLAFLLVGLNSLSVQAQNDSTLLKTGELLENGGQKFDITNQNSFPANVSSGSTAIITQALVNLILPALILIFGFIVIHYISNSFSRLANFKPEHGVQLISITLITVGILFLVSVAIFLRIDNGVFAPAFGLLGTLAGYILGKNASKSKVSGRSDSKTDGKA